MNTPSPWPAVNQLRSILVPPKVRVPRFPHLAENNVRTGFLEDSQYDKLIEGAEAMVSRIGRVRPQLWLACPGTAIYARQPGGRVTACYPLGAR